jgi:hypothetical protein
LLEWDKFMLDSGVDKTSSSKTIRWKKMEKVTAVTMMLAKSRKYHLPTILSRLIPQNHATNAAELLR